MSGSRPLFIALAALLAQPGCGKDAEAVDDAAQAARTAEEGVEGGPPWRPGYRRPLVIDIHAHIMPTGLQRLSKIMADNGLGLVVNLSGGNQKRGLSTAVEMQKVFPGIINYYTPNWREVHLPDFGEREAKRLEEAVETYGFKGLKIAKALGLYVAVDDNGNRKLDPGERLPVDWPGLDPLWAKAGELGVPVSIHTGDPKAFWEPLTPANERYEELRLHPNWSFAGPEYPSREALLEQRNRVIAKHSKTTFVCVHFGGNPEDIDAVDKWLDTYPNMMIDVAARVPEFGRHPPDKVRAFFVKHKTRVLFGTDLGVSKRGLMLGSSGEEEPTMDDVKPFYDAHWRYFEGSEKQIAHPTPVQGNWKIDAVNLPDDVLEHFYYKNAMKLLDLEPPQGQPGSTPR